MSQTPHINFGLSDSDKSSEDNDDSDQVILIGGKNFLASYTLSNNPRVFEMPKMEENELLVNDNSLNKD